MSCYLYKMGFAETVLVISAATSVSASPRAGHPDPVTVQVDRYIQRNAEQLGQAPGRAVLFSGAHMTCCLGGLFISLLPAHEFKQGFGVFRLCQIITVKCDTVLGFNTWMYKKLPVSQSSRTWRSWAVVCLPKKQPVGMFYMGKAHDFT